MEISFFDLILRSIKFPFKDPDWFKKVAIGSGLLLAMFIIPIVPVLVITGYGKRIMQRIIVEDGEPYLPEWDDWSKLLTDGLKLYGVNLIFSLPILVLIFAAYVLFMVGAIFVPILMTSSNGADPSSSIWIMVILPLIAFAIFLLAIPLSILVSLFQSPAQGHLVAKDSFSAAFHFKEWWPILKKGISAFMIAILVYMGLTLIFTMVMQILSVTIILLPVYFILLIPYSFLSMVYKYTFDALAYREGVKKLAQG